VPRNHPLDVLDAHPLGLARIDQMAEKLVDPLERQVGLEAAPEQQLVERAFQLAAARGDVLGDMGENVSPMSSVASSIWAIASRWRSISRRIS
jgi:hypothetical protein